ncbi:MAG: hypothetical protein Q8O07_00340 [Chloroflexota bacterium]|nr:hypothetical protein [Chloroflexota bacterium]
MAGLVLVVLVAVQAASSWQLYDAIDRWGAPGGFGIPLASWQRVAEQARQEARSAGVSEVFGLTEGHQPRYDEKPAILDYLLRPELSPRWLPLRPSYFLILPVGRPSLYLATLDDSWLHQGLSRLGNLKADIRMADGRQRARLYAIPTYSPAQVIGLPPIQADVSFSTGLRLVGYAAPQTVRAGATLSITTYWLIENVQDADRGRDYSVTYRLLGPDGRQWGQEDGLGWPRSAWLNGEMLIHWYGIPISATTSPGEYALYSEIYSLDDGARVPILDSGGQPVGESHRMFTIGVTSGN